MLKSRDLPSQDITHAHQRTFKQPATWVMQRDSYTVVTAFLVRDACVPIRLTPWTAVRNTDIGLLDTPMTTKDAPSVQQQQQQIYTHK